jgi:hypothetical protein
VFPTKTREREKKKMNLTHEIETAQVTDNLREYMGASEIEYLCNSCGVLFVNGDASHMETEEYTRVSDNLSDLNHLGGFVEFNAGVWFDCYGCRQAINRGGLFVAIR